MNDAFGLAAATLLVSGMTGSDADRKAVAALDTSFQTAVKHNDVDTIDRILHPDYALVRGDGKVVSREAIVESARKRDTIYEVQDEEPGTQVVRVWGDTAVVTALLHIKGRTNGETFARSLWFSDTYVRTKSGWRYAFAQVSLPLPQTKRVGD